VPLCLCAYYFIRMKKSHGFHLDFQHFAFSVIILMIFLIFSAASLPAEEVPSFANDPVFANEPAFGTQPIFANKLITDIQILTSDPTIMPQVRYLLDLQVGDIFNQERLDQGIDRLKMLDIFSSVQVEKQPDLYGVKLSVTLKKQPIIEEISISGNYPLFKNEVNKVISAHIGDPFDLESLQQSACDIEQLYQAEGYYQVRVSIHADKNTRKKVKVVFRIEKGWRTKVQEVQFEKDGKKIKSSFAFQSILGIYSGNFLREAKLKKNIKQMESILINQGFLKVKISYEVVHLPNNYAVLKIIINRGQIVHVRFQGNRSINDDLLRSKITLFENRSYAEFDLQESIDDIKEIYLEHGFPFIDASYEKKIRGNGSGNGSGGSPRPQGLPAGPPASGKEDAGEGEVWITFLIKEGKKVYLDKVTFEGNRGISSKKLAGQMLSLQSITPFHRNVFNKLVYEEDLKALEALYAIEGYPWAEIFDGNTTFSSNRRLLSKTVSIHEGPRVLVQNVFFQGNRLFADSVLMKKVALNPGSYFTEKKWQQDRKELAIFYSNHGYVFVKVTPKVDFDKEKGLVELSYIIDEGPKAFFGKSIIKGNVKTRYSAIRDSLVFSQGEEFSYEAIIESNNNLSDLGIFRAVRVKPIGLEKEGKNTVMEKDTDILVEVEEMDTGRANLGVGFNSVQGYRGYLELQENNLAGTFLATSLRLDYSGIGKQYSLSDGIQYSRKVSLNINDPLLVSRQKIDGTFSLFDTYEEKVGYDLRQNGVNIRLGKYLKKTTTKTTNFSMTYRLEAARLHNVDPALLDPEGIPDEDQELTICSIKPVLSFDTRDSFFNPRRGGFAQIGFELAGGLMGGERRFSKLTTSMVEFLPLSRRLILALEMSGGCAWVPSHQNLPIQESFFAGGLNSVRGYMEDSLGPKNNNVPTGGKILLVNNLEFRCDLYRQLLNGVLFFDAGNVWDNYDNVALGDVRTSAGSGLRLVTPVGPIRLDYAWVLGRKQGEPNGKFYISVGHAF
jgi:outer membrane protein insertion porin family